MIDRPSPPAHLFARVLRGVGEIALIVGIILLLWYVKPLAVFAGLLFVAAAVGRMVGR